VNKKQNIIQAAAHLFADQGFDGTTTIQISREAGVTEPLIYYHFKGKDDLFTQILESVFQDYFDRLTVFDDHPGTEMDKIEALVALHFQFVDEKPDEIYLTFSTCPAKLNDPDHICARNIQRQREHLKAMLIGCLERGVASGEFTKVPIVETAHLIIALITGWMRLRGLKIDALEGMKEVTTEFIRRSLAS
jgi:AcrR family transcriptional regulator